MKKFLAFVIAFAFTFGLIAFAAPTDDSNNEIRVIIDGEYVEFLDQNPVIIDGRTLVPIRGVFEALGFELGWDSASRTAVLWRSDYFLRIRIDDPVFTTNGEEYELDVPAQIINGRTLVPIRFPLESIGVHVDWDEEERNVVIFTSEIPVEQANGVSQGNTPNVTLAPGQTPAPSVAPTSTPRTTPRPTVSGAPPPNPTPTPTPTPSPPPRPSTQFPSSITMPNRRLTESERQNWIDDYHRQGGASTFENDVVRLINEEREKFGLNELTVDPALMLAGRFYTQIMNDLNTGLGHNKGPYATNPSATHGASRIIVELFGGRITWNGGNGAFGHATAAGVVNGWMGSDGHKDFILNANHQYIGVGRFGTLTYLFLSSQTNMDTPAPTSTPTATATPTPTTTPTHTNGPNPTATPVHTHDVTTQGALNFNP